MNRLLPSLLLCGAIICSASLFGQNVVVLDDGPSTGLNPGVSILSGTWSYRTEAQHSGTYLNTGSRFSGNANAQIQYRTTLPTAGIWSMEVYVTNTLNRSDPTVTITHGDGTASTSFGLNQANTNSAAQDQWMSLGTYNFDGGSINYDYRLALANVNQNQNTDAVRWVKVEAGNPHGATPIVVDRLGGIQGFYSETGTWENSSNQNGTYGTANRFTTTLDSTATFTAPLAAYIYEIQVNYNPLDSRTSQALVEVLDAHGNITDLRINQQEALTDDTGLGVSWLSLGEFALDGSSSVSFINDLLAFNSGDFMVTDSVRFIPVAAIPEPSIYALIFGALGLGVILIRRFRLIRAKP